MEKHQFKSAIRSLINRALSNKVDREEGRTAPTLDRMVAEADIDGIRSFDPKLATLVVKMEDAHKELDDYLLSIHKEMLERARR